MTNPQLPPRYELLGPLGAGGMGVVSWVLDRETGREVALKQLRVPEGVDPSQARFLFRQEFWNMTSLRHPNLVEALDYGEGPDGLPYMTMAMIPGHDLTMGRSEADVRSWLPQIAAALAYLHGRGMVHGDLKPDNIRLQPDGKATLMDLGLLLPAGRAGEPIRGSIDYMAPEVIRQGAIDARSDLYSLGALLYHALTGRPPFEHADPIVVLRAHLGTRPARLQSRTTDASPEMDAAVMKLLAKEPAQRFASVAQLLAALGMEAEVDEQAGLLASPVLGRDDARAALREPEGKVLWLVGPAGSGKTRLLGEARAEAQLAGLPTTWLQGAGIDAAPYQAALPLLRTVAGEARANAPELLPVLARVLPELGVEPGAPLDGVSERLRLQATVAGLARAVFPRGRWLVDNADALDPASQELLQALQKETGAEWTWLFAAEAAPAGAASLVLEPLPDEAITAIAAQQLGQEEIPAGLADKLVPLAAGLPGAVEALLSHWIEQDRLVRSAGRWQANGAFDLPGGLRVALDARLAALDDDARQLAQTAAILGATGDLRWLAGIAGLPDDRFFKALRELEGADVLAADERNFRFTRASQAVALSASLDEAERRRLHDAAADWAVAQSGHEPAQAGLAEALAVAEHGLAGATPARAVPWVLAAAAGAITQFTLEPAEALLTRAVALPDLPAKDLLALERLQANVWRHQGRAKDALGRYETANLLERLKELDPALLAEETTNYGALLSVAGRYDDARRVLADATRLAEGDAATGVRARIYAGRAAYFGGDPTAAKAVLAEAVALGREARAKGQPVLLAVALSFLGYFLASGGNPTEGLAALEEAVERARESGNPVQSNEALSMLGNVYVAEGRPLDARKAFEGILATCRRYDLPYDELMARLNLGATLLELGDGPGARENAEKVAEEAKARQRKFPEAYARAVAGRARIQLGELAAGQAELQAGLAIAREINSRYLELHAMVPWIDALLVLGRLAEAHEAIKTARGIAAELKNTEHDHQLDRLEMEAALQDALATDASLTTLAVVGERLAGWTTRLRGANRPGDLAFALYLQASWALRCGDQPAGVAFTEEAAKLAEEAGLRLLWARIIFTRAKLAAAACLINSSVAGLVNAAVNGFADAGEVADELGDVRLDALCRAGALAVQGLNSQLKVIARQLERMTEGLSPEEASAFMDHPDHREVMRALPLAGISGAARDVIGLMARFDEEADLNTLLKRAVASMVVFAGAERGFLLLFDAMDVTHKVVFGMTHREADAFSTSLAYQVLWTEEPLFVEDAQEDSFFSRQASVLALDLRSVVGVPLVGETGTLGVLIADSRKITLGFGDAHLDLVAALAKRVAGAIEGTHAREAAARAQALVDLRTRVAAATAGVKDLEAFMAPVAAEALKLTDADRVCLVLGPELECRLAFDREGKVLAAADQAPSQSAVRWVFEQGQALHLHDALTSESFSGKQSVMALGLRTIHAVPVSHAGEVQGVLYLDDKRVGTEDPHVMEGLKVLGGLVGAWLSR